MIVIPQSKLINYINKSGNSRRQNVNNLFVQSISKTSFIIRQKEYQINKKIRLPIVII